MSNVRPRYHLAEVTARSVLTQARVSSLPVDLKEIVRCAPKRITLKTYSWISKNTGLTTTDIEMNWKSKEGFTQYDKHRDSFIIFLNDLEPNKCRRRWTLAHEFGHIALNHFGSLYTQNANRFLCPDNVYEAFELEAHCFARCLLAPPNVLFAAEIESNINYIMQACEISFEAAKKVKDFFERGKERVIYETKEIPLIQNFASYIDRWKTGFFCTICGAQSYTEMDFCHICGKVYSQWKGICGMRYSSIELGTGNRAKECPKCNNENIIGDHCQICGALIVNRCLNFSPEGVSYSYDCDCGKLVPGDARYCPDCGNETSFLREGYLSDWESESSSKLEKMSLPFDL